MNDYKGLIGRLRNTGGGDLGIKMCNDAADAIEQLLHERFVIGETLVAVSKYEIAPVDALEKIRKVLRGEI